MLTKRIIFLIIFFFSLQSWAKADDIRDFQIEGMSIGDSLLDFMKKKEIDSKKVYFKSKIGIKKEYSSLFIDRNNLDNFDDVRIYFKSIDKNYAMESIAGYKYFQNDIEDCKSFKKSIVYDVSIVAKNSTKKEYPNYKLTGSDGTRYMTVFSFKDFSAIKAICYDYKSDTFKDRFTLIIETPDWRNFQKHRAFK